MIELAYEALLFRFRFTPKTMPVSHAHLALHCIDIRFMRDEFAFIRNTVRVRHASHRVAVAGA